MNTSTNSNPSEAAPDLLELESNVIPFPKDDSTSAGPSDEPTLIPFPVRYEHKGKTYYVTIPATSWLDTLSRIKAIKRTMRLNLQ